MCLLLETIRVRNGSFCHSEYHQERMERSQATLFGEPCKIRLCEIDIPGNLPPGEVKCRLVYGREIVSIEFLPYRKKKIRTLVFAEAGRLEYPLKYLERSAIEQIRSRYRTADEIILVKNGFITDSSYSNLAFLSGHEWHTPAEPLLKGTCRQRLVDEGRLRLRNIKPGDIGLFTHVSLINAMMDLEEQLLPVSAIRPHLISGQNLV